MKTKPPTVEDLVGTRHLLRQAANEYGATAGFDVYAPDRAAQYLATAALLTALCNRADAMLDASPTMKPTGEETLLNQIPGWRQAVSLSATWLGVDLNPLQRVGQQIMSDHWAQFNRGLWGTIVSVTDVVPDGARESRIVWGVSWPDGGGDLWVPEDPDAAYQYRDPA